jgi:hypothetical protein
MQDTGLQTDLRTSGLSASHPCSYPPARKSCPPPHHPPRKLFRRTARIRCLGLETVPGQRQVPLPCVLELPCETDQFSSVQGVWKNARNRLG